MIYRMGTYAQRNLVSSEYALHFDATYKDVVALPNSFVTGARTISTWVKPDVTTFNGQARQVFMAQYTTSGKRTMYAEFRDTGVIRVYFPTSTTGNSAVNIESDAGVYFNANQWYYITMVSDSSSGGLLYIDGVLQTATVPSATFGFTRSGSPFNWGGWSYIYSGLNNSDATLKELAIWNTARTQSEIVADMTRTFNGGETGLKAYFPTSEGSGNTIQDINSVYTGTLSTISTVPNYIDNFMWVTY